MNVAKLRALPFVVLLLPLDLILACVILVTDLLSLPLRLFRGKPKSFAAADVASVTVQILNWDGLHLLKECLPSVVDAVRQYSNRTGGSHEVVVVDNGSRDGSIDFLRDGFPNVRVVRLDRNYGFAGGNNRGFAHVHSDVVVLLNNDMKVAPDFLEPLLAPFSDAGVFAVASQIFFPDRNKRRQETGLTRGEFESGFFRFWHGDIPDGDGTSSAVPVFWAGGGSCAMDLRKAMSIGGFDSLYDPFYVEDTDISWQAWKRGWKCLLGPQSHVVHQHRGTSRPRFGDDFVDRMIRRNQFLFVWKNVTDLAMTLEHLVALPWIHGSSIIQHGVRFEVGCYVRALIRLPLAVWRRASNLSRYVVSDRDVMMRTQ